MYITSKICTLTARKVSVNLSKQDQFWFPSQEGGDWPYWRTRLGIQHLEAVDIPEVNWTQIMFSNLGTVSSLLNVGSVVTIYSLYTNLWMNKFCLFHVAESDWFTWQLSHMCISDLTQACSHTVISLIWCVHSCLGDCSAKAASTFNLDIQQSPWLLTSKAVCGKAKPLEVVCWASVNWI